MAGLTTRVATDVGPLIVPRGLILPTIFYHLVNHDYELPELALLDQQLHDDDRVIELGAGPDGAQLPDGTAAARSVSGRSTLTSHGGARKSSSESSSRCSQSAPT